jgi:hypothetical protein
MKTFLSYQSASGNLHKKVFIKYLLHGKGTFDGTSCYAWSSKRIKRFFTLFRTRGGSELEGRDQLPEMTGGVS